MSQMKANDMNTRNMRTKKRRKTENDCPGEEM